MFYVSLRDSLGERTKISLILRLLNFSSSISFIILFRAVREGGWFVHCALLRRRRSGTVGKYTVDIHVFVSVYMCCEERYTRLLSVKF